MKKTIIASILLAVVPVVAKSQQVSFSGGSKAVFEETPAASTGLDKIYVIYDSDGVSMNYVQHGSGTTVTWYTYDERGGGYAEVLPSVERVDASTTRLPQVMANCGYIIEEGTDRTYLWVVDYSDYMLTLGNIGFDPQRDCGTTRLYVGGSGGAITYYTINGVPQNLDRGLTLTYRTLEWNDSNMTWDEIPVEENIEKIESIFEQAERDRIIANNIRYQEANVRQVVADMTGGSPYFPMGFTIKKSDDKFIWISYETTYVSQYVFVYKYPATSVDDLGLDRILSESNAILKQNVPGPVEDSYMITAAMPVPQIKSIRYNNRDFVEVRGLWEVQNDYMGGPFVIHAFYDKTGENVIVLQAFVYAPKFDKRNYLRQVESIIYSFEWMNDKEDGRKK